MSERLALRLAQPLIASPPGPASSDISLLRSAAQELGEREPDVKQSEEEIQRSFSAAERAKSFAQLVLARKIALDDDAANAKKSAKEAQELLRRVISDGPFSAVNVKEKVAELRETEIAATYARLAREAKKCLDSAGVQVASQAEKDEKDSKSGKVKGSLLESTRSVLLDAKDVSSGDECRVKPAGRFSDVAAAAASVSNLAAVLCVLRFQSRVLRLQPLSLVQLLSNEVPQMVEGCRGLVARHLAYVSAPVGWPGSEQELAKTLKYGRHQLFMLDQMDAGEVDFPAATSPLTLLARRAHKRYDRFFEAMHLLLRLEASSVLALRDGVAVADGESTSSLSPLVIDETYFPNRVPAATWAVQHLCEPLIRRFVFHFRTERKTNNLLKPQWMFAHVLGWIQAHWQFVSHAVQPLYDGQYRCLSCFSATHPATFSSLSELQRRAFCPSDESIAGLIAGRSATLDFVRVLVDTVRDKLRHDIPALIQIKDESEGQSPVQRGAFFHCINECLRFDNTLRDIYDFAPGVDSGCMAATDVFAESDESLSVWIDCELQYIQSRWNSYRASAAGDERELKTDFFLPAYNVADGQGSPEIWAQSSTNDLEPNSSATQGGEITVGLLAAVTKRWQHSSAYDASAKKVIVNVDAQLQFVTTVQRYLIVTLTSACKHAVSKLLTWADAFHTTPDVVRYAGVANTLLFVRDTVEAWMDHKLCWLDLQSSCEEPLFGDTLDCMRKLEDRICNALGKFIAHQFMRLIPRYCIRRLWRGTDATALSAAIALSPQLADGVDFVRDTLGMLHRSLSPSLFDRVWSISAAGIDVRLVEQVEANHEFVIVSTVDGIDTNAGGETGGSMFAHDVYAIFSVFARYSSRPQDHLWRLHELSLLASLSATALEELSAQLLDARPTSRVSWRPATSASDISTASTAQVRARAALRALGVVHTDLADVHRIIGRFIRE